jgi:ankyrin repeat protein
MKNLEIYILTVAIVASGHASICSAMNESDEYNSQTPSYKVRALYDTAHNANERGTPSYQDIDVQDQNGNTRLHHAIVGGKLRAVVVLLNGGANKTLPNNEGVTALDLLLRKSPINSTDGKFLTRKSSLIE